MRLAAPDARSPEQSEVDKIRRTLEGETLSDDGTMLGGVLQEIRRRGSVVDQTVLDQTLLDDVAPEFPPATDANRGLTPPPAEHRAHRSPTEKQFQTAEQLLRTARLLGETSPDDPDTAELVNQMRRTAIKLLAP